MADLDDFFAKKDKKKSKGKKFATAEEVAKKLEDTTSKRAEQPKPRKERPVGAPLAGDGEETGEKPEQHRQQEDEWKEFQEEERKDYSGLKIGQLTITEEQQNQTNLGGNDVDSYNDGSSDGEGNEGSDKREYGPWKKVQGSMVEEIPMGVGGGGVGGGGLVQLDKTAKVYVSPAFRNQPLRAAKTRNRTAPDITNEDYFPTLGAARPEEQRKKKNEPAFEEVRHGSRITRVQEIQAPAAVSIGNRFKSLADDDS